MPRHVVHRVSQVDLDARHASADGDGGRIQGVRLIEALQIYGSRSAGDDVQHIVRLEPRPKAEGNPASAIRAGHHLFEYVALHAIDYSG